MYFQTYAMRDITIKTKKNSNSSLFSILKNKSKQLLRCRSHYSK